MVQWNSQQLQLRAAWKYERDRMRPAAKYEPALTFIIVRMCFVFACAQCTV